ncbi:Putative metabolite transport protein YjhB [Paraburkholderia nemoris]|uniref:Metabolite transport protein YjhB n=1 Tax=Paraburkholderia nemoris TaxID=2793076 RepID=A0ABM8T286_9BURK|nr:MULTISPECIES: MFS transporter [Paraburkholderia]MBK3740665.1 MFS transporter [Paraburkholderia aspalathi]MBK3782885.1 MFS transporter [Paraburkholderia aspalathi]MBK3815934.1 MFS transporter [Paraburkholderia aspalathi]CAE6755102.1 Putative metabolite transport protein YjhB [Paraburkholderia nemoris]CAE6755920.1 Putative metabolite transport protein YjhB [Paraburkholderia nemoris]
MTVASSATETREPARSGYAGRALIASVLGYAMDGFDLLILGFMLPVIAADLNLSSAQAGSLVTWTLIGAVAGGLIFGVLSDYFGRVRMLTWTILIFAVFTGLCALAQGYTDLLAYRTIAGIGLGGEFGIGMTLVAEAWPASQRARVSSYVGLGWQLGVLAAALLTPLLLPVIGWRGMFALGLLPAVVSFVVRRRVEEPALFTERVARGMRKLPLKLLVADGRTTRASIGVAILCSVQNFGYYGLMIWLPSYLSKTFGYSLTRSGVWTAVTVLGMACGIWLFGMAADRFGRKPTFLFYQVGAVVMVFVYAHLTTPMALLIGGAAMGVFVNGMIGGYGALISELYPTDARATAQNVLFNVGRAVGGFGPVVVGALAARYSFGAALALLASIYLLDIFATLILIPERRGAELE